jgi:hypothetical protein
MSTPSVHRADAPPLAVNFSDIPSNAIKYTRAEGRIDK